MLRKRSCILMVSVVLLSACSADTLPVASEPIATESATPKPISTSTPISLHALTGTVFFDYNGSGEQDLAYGIDSDEHVEEPGIADVQVCLEAIGHEDVCTRTDGDGSFSFDELPIGWYRMTVESPTDDPVTAFRYINTNRGWVDAEAYEIDGIQVVEQHLPITSFQPISEYIPVNLGEDTNCDVALMQGYLTLPFDPGGPVCVISYEDLALCESGECSPNNSLDGIVRDWAACTNIRRDYRACSPCGVYDWHWGIDYGYGTDYAQFVAYEIFSAAPGIVEATGPVDPQYRGGSVRLLHSDGRRTHYDHLGEVHVYPGQRVHRGTILGRIWLDWAEPHLHLGLLGKEGEGFLQWQFWRLAIYRDPLNPASISYWTVDNNPQYPQNPIQ